MDEIAEQKEHEDTLASDRALRNRPEEEGVGRCRALLSPSEVRFLLFCCFSFSVAEAGEGGEEGRAGEEGEEEGPGVRNGC